LNIFIPSEFLTTGFTFARYLLMRRKPFYFNMIPVYGIRAIWQLPEKLVWLVVAAAALALLPLQLARTIGFNLLLVASVIYCFQGLSIVLFFLNKWKVPLFIRSLLYVIIVFQSLGTIFLSVIGLADVWFDLRHDSSQDSNQKKPL